MRLRFWCLTPLLITSAPESAAAHEVGQRLGGFSSSEGEVRSMARFNGQAEAPTLASGEIQLGLTINAVVERVKIDEESPASSKYMTEHFPEGRRLDRAFGSDATIIYMKRSEFSAGGGVSGDGVTKTSTKRASIGQWFFNDQLRLGVFASTAETSRPADYFLDYDSETIRLRPRVVASTGGIALKAVLNPTTILTSDYSMIESTDRPTLHAWNAGVRQFFSPCDCAVHAGGGRIVNTGKLDTTMASGELTGWQWEAAFLSSLWRHGHGRIGYRFAREDEFTRAYGDHLVFGSDSYTAAISHEFQKARLQGVERPMLTDIAVTRYIHNKSGAATTMEAGASVRF